MKLYIIYITTLTLMGTYLQADMTNKERVCKSILECEKHSNTIQAKIDELEKKGIENLTNEEFEKLDLLQNKLFATKDSTIVLQKAKTARQREIIVEAKAETARERAETSEIEKTNEILDKLGALLK